MLIILLPGQLIYQFLSRLINVSWRGQETDINALQPLQYKFNLFILPQSLTAALAKGIMFPGCSSYSHECNISASPGGDSCATIIHFNSGMNWLDFVGQRSSSAIESSLSQAPFLKYPVREQIHVRFAASKLQNAAFSYASHYIRWYFNACFPDTISEGFVFVH